MDKIVRIRTIILVINSEKSEFFEVQDLWLETLFGGLTNYGGDEGVQNIIFHFPDRSQKP
ncbi:MAG: hypothetical protein ACYCRD_06750 [Leptospirillum sp.]